MNRVNVSCPKLWENLILGIKIEIFGHKRNCSLVRICPQLKSGAAPLKFLDPVRLWIDILTPERRKMHQLTISKDKDRWLIPDSNMAHNCLFGNGAF